ncbi:hypothetical protein PRZ48_005219 [Zasmidium cellare]|uniref:Uncharacterized protein n=1 Tax=Zasmidium cellare TaxID=395010 RepID=A0ABR0ET02_ZASCE|nr:hypothetical protein PRZ48_005219 [Zasmidium cellare]
MRRLRRRRRPPSPGQLLNGLSFGRTLLMSIYCGVLPLAGLYSEVLGFHDVDSANGKRGGSEGQRPHRPWYSRPSRQVRGGQDMRVVWKQEELKDSFDRAVTWKIMM